MDITIAGEYMKPEVYKFLLSSVFCGRRSETLFPEFTLFYRGEGKFPSV